MKKSEGVASGAINSRGTVIARVKYRWLTSGDVLVHLSPRSSGFNRFNCKLGVDRPSVSGIGKSLRW